MVCNGRGVGAVHCCFDKLLMTSVERGLHTQSQRNITERQGREWWEGGEKERDRAICLLLSRTDIHVQGGEGVGWRCCHVKGAIGDVISWRPGQAHTHRLPFLCHRRQMRRGVLDAVGLSPAASLHTEESPAGDLHSVSLCGIYCRGRKD